MQQKWYRSAVSWQILFLVSSTVLTLPHANGLSSAAEDTVEVFRELLTNRASTPPFDDSEAPGAWRFSPSQMIRGYRLPANITRRIIDDLGNRNFSLQVVFKPDLNTTGSLFSMVSGFTRFLEVVSDLKKLQLTVFLSVRDSVHSWAIQVNISDGEFHEFLLEIHRDRVMVLLDCVLYLSRDVSGLFQVAMPTPGSARPAEIWLGQRDQEHSKFAGLVRTVSVSRGHVLRQTKCPQNEAEQKQPAKSYQIKKKPQAQLEPLDFEAPEQDSEEEQDTDAADASITSVVAAASNQKQRQQVAFDPKMKAKVEFLEHKVNYLDAEFKKVREHVAKYELQVRRVQLHQRGCYVGNEWFQEGRPIPAKTNCTECVCFEGKMLCSPIGCKPATCANPVREPDHCCPLCKDQCLYVGKTFEHGVSYSPKKCVRCTCDDGHMMCQYQNAKTCPALKCVSEKQLKPPGECCSVCVDEDLCAAAPCHANATCKQRKFSRECHCKDGYFGNGEDCFDIDECQLRSAGSGRSCGSGTRCLNFPGSFKCECLPGYIRIDDFTCLDTFAI